jgi:hypothetical protein
MAGCRKEKRPQLSAGAVEPRLLTLAGYNSDTIGRLLPQVKYWCAEMTSQVSRAIVYIDGFNLYHGLMQAGLRTSRWLDLVALSRSLLLSDQSLAATRYFTTRVRGKPQKSARQGLFLDALLGRGDIEIAYGHFLAKEISYRNCGSRWSKNGGEADGSCVHALGAGALVNNESGRPRQCRLFTG